MNARTGKDSNGNIFSNNSNIGLENIFNLLHQPLSLKCIKWIWFIIFPMSVLSTQYSVLGTHSPCPRPVDAGRSVCRQTISVWRWSGHCTPSWRHRSWQSFVWRGSPLSKWHHLQLSLYYLCFYDKMLQYIWNIAQLNFLFLAINYRNWGAKHRKRVMTSEGTNKITTVFPVPLLASFSWLPAGLEG